MEKLFEQIFIPKEAIKYNTDDIRYCYCKICNKMFEIKLDYYGTVAKAISHLYIEHNISLKISQNNIKEYFRI